MSLIIIELENMEFHACHGCYPLEQVVGNRFLVDVKIEADLSKAAASDNVADTINYLNVFETVREQMDIPSHILEHVARRIADAIHLRFPQAGKVSVKGSATRGENRKSFCNPCGIRVYALFSGGCVDKLLIRLSEGSFTILVQFVIL